MNKKIILSTIAIVISLVTMAQVTAEWKEYKIESMGFTIKHPPTWKLNDKSDRAVFFITSPKETAEDKFEENFNLQYGDYTKTLKDYIKENVDELKTFDNFKKESERQFTNFGKETYEIVFTATVSGIDFPLRWKQWYVLNKKKGYVITYCMAADKKDKYESIANAIFRTIRIK